MALADFAAYKAAFATLHQVVNYHRSTFNPGSQQWFSTFSNASATQFPAPIGGDPLVAAPTTAAACSASTTGALIRSPAGSGDQIVVAGYTQPAGNVQSAWLIDRLSHQGGLSGTTTTTQTTNLPTAALTRYTSGVGVFAALEFYTAVGATDAVWTVVYTNQAGTGSRSVSFIMGQTPSANGFIIIPLQGTDSGVRSVESVTLTPSTGTAGNFGVTLFKPLCFIPGTPSRITRPLDIFSLPGWNTPIDDSACLQWLLHGGSSSLTQQVLVRLGES